MWFLTDSLSAMEQKNDLSFNCAESVIIGVQRTSPIPGCESSCMRVASVLGGGISGSGEVCGAVSGGVICLGIIGGTEGNELPEDFKEKRGHIREVVKGFLNEFESNWGSVRCGDLVAMDKGELESKGLLRTTNGQLKNHCDDYVEWSRKRIIQLIKEQSENPT